ncbi:MAG: hypothetical protein ABSG89_05040 [Bacteroidales bacterium]|jgi:hypothetical protein
MKIIRYLLFFFLAIFIAIAILVTFQFLINTKYSFPVPGVFRGEELYNPYTGIDSSKWKRANFHLHTRLPLKLTAGFGNTIQTADSFYKYFDYDIHSISDYMRINNFNSGSKSYVPVYEHGYSYYKTHQLVLNAHKVCWKEYLFHQTLNDKQAMIDRIKRDTSVLVTIVHPFLRKGYSTSDFRYLGNYDCLEIANNLATCARFYDAALSAGHAVFIMADDDAHDLSKISEGAHSFNIINSDPDRNSILHALRTGRSYGVNLNLHGCKTSEEKKAAIDNLPVLREFELKNDTITVSMNKEVDSIKFIGQNGILKKSVAGCRTGSYPFGKEDTYIRTEVIAMDGSICFLNPVIRYDGSKLPVSDPQINIPETWGCRLLFVVILFGMIFLIIKYGRCTTGRK